VTLGLLPVPFVWFAVKSFLVSIYMRSPCRAGAPKAPGAHSRPLKKRPDGLPGRKILW
jgi:hypothetical protein